MQWGYNTLITKTFERFWFRRKVDLSKIEMSEMFRHPTFLPYVSTFWSICPKLMCPKFKFLKFLVINVLPGSEWRRHYFINLFALFSVACLGATFLLFLCKVCFFAILKNFLQFTIYCDSQFGKRSQVMTLFQPNIPIISHH